MAAQGNGDRLARFHVAGAAGQRLVQRFFAVIQQIVTGKQGDRHRRRTRFRWRFHRNHPIFADCYARLIGDCRRDSCVARRHCRQRAGRDAQAPAAIRADRGAVSLVAQRNGHDLTRLDIGWAAAQQLIAGFLIVAQHVIHGELIERDSGLARPGNRRLNRDRQRVADGGACRVADRDHQRGRTCCQCTECIGRNRNVPAAVGANRSAVVLAA